VDTRAVIASPDVPDVYLVPSRLQAEGLDELVSEKLGLPPGRADLGEWLDLTERLQRADEEVEIALVGKYVKLQDAYLSVHEALKHAGAHNGCRGRVRWVVAENMLYAEGTRAREAYGESVIHERHRHRYEVNNHYRPMLIDGGLVVAGTFQEGRLVEIVELPDHPWFVASQFHPEFKSRPTRPAPLFRGFVGAALARARARSGQAVASTI